LQAALVIEANLASSTPGTQLLQIDQELAARGLTVEPPADGDDAVRTPLLSDFGQSVVVRFRTTNQQCSLAARTLTR
jgi:hypothetical protein